MNFFVIIELLVPVVKKIIPSVAEIIKAIKTKESTPTDSGAEEVLAQLISKLDDDFKALEAGLGKMQKQMDFVSGAKVLIPDAVILYFKDPITESEITAIKEEIDGNKVIEDAYKYGESYVESDFAVFNVACNDEKDGRALDETLIDPMKKLLQEFGVAVKKIQYI
jgi:hypothetical protein